MMKIKRTLLVLISTLIVSVAWGYEQPSSGLAFLKVNPDIRISAMGGAGLASVGPGSSPSSLMMNPALNRAVGGTTAELGHSFWFANRGIEFLGVTFPAADWNLAFLATSANVSGFEYRDNRATDDPIDIFGANYLAAGINAAKLISPKLTVGIQANYLYEKIFYQSATGFAFSAGAQYQWSERLSLGAALNHLGFMRELEHESTPLPSVVRVGGAYAAPLGASPFGIQVTADGGYYFNDYAFAAGGLELDYRQSVFLRGGAMYSPEQVRPALGFGIHWDRFTASYSLIFPDDAMDMPQQLSLTVQL